MHVVQTADSLLNFAPRAPLEYYVDPTSQYYTRDMEDDLTLFLLTVKLVDGNFKCLLYGRQSIIYIFF